MGSIYYHGTTEANPRTILKKGFKKGTYFTWDLHSALVMGGMWVFAVYFKDKDPTKSYWEYITPKLIKKNKILYLRKFDVECIYDNEDENIKLREIMLKENRGKDVILCKACSGRGQLNESQNLADGEEEIHHIKLMGVKYVAVLGV